MEGKRLTSYAMEELECPKCGHKHSLKKYKVINVTEKAKLKEEIMKNRLYQFSCEECEYMAPLTYDSLYVDSQRNIMIYMAPVMNAEIKAEIAELEQEKGIGKITLTREFYRQVEDKYKDAIKEHSMDSFMKVDMEWAGKILFKNHNKFN